MSDEGKKQAFEFEFKYKSETGVEFLEAQTKSGERFLTMLKEMMEEIPSILGSMKQKPMGSVTPFPQAVKNEEEEEKFPVWYRPAVARRIQNLQGEVLIGVLFQEFVAAFDYPNRPFPLEFCLDEFLTHYKVKANPDVRALWIVFLRTAGDQKILMVGRYFEGTGASVEFMDEIAVDLKLKNESSPSEG
jgi:hypothetical protein